jgi:uncharacterized membrane protein SirB2
MGIVKLLHMTFAALSFFGFVSRGLLMIAGSPLLKARFVRVAPHVVDTGLLAAGIALMTGIHQYPFVNAWLTVKLLALLAYIGLGMVALRFGRSGTVRVSAWVAAMGLFLYIGGVALTHSPSLGFA